MKKLLGNLEAGFAKRLFGLVRSCLMDSNLEELNESGNSHALKYSKMTKSLYL